AEVEETLKRIQSHKGVIGTMVVNAEGPVVGLGPTLIQYDLILTNYIFKDSISK
ncbi:Dynein light chain roadblock-type 2, partial [Eschrichtius robustus]|nr:Dynein light chain roadblock-type 2 [Eschrichtius robustus]